MDSGVRESGPDLQHRWTFAEVGKGSLIDRLTREAQAARDAAPYGTVLVDGRRYTMREDWWDVAERAAAKFGSEK